MNDAPASITDQRAGPSPADPGPARAESGADSATEREIKRLQWQCRRGMLELDLLLNHFLQHGYAELDGDARRAFERLLGMPDQILQDWLIGQAVPADAELSALIARIRAAIRTAP